jgi:hypothetical protein
MAKIKSEDLLQSIRETAPSILARDVDKIDDVLESIGDAIKKLTTDYTFEHIQHDGVDKNGKKISVDELRIRVPSSLRRRIADDLIPEVTKEIKVGYTQKIHPKKFTITFRLNGKTENESIGVGSAKGRVTTTSLTKDANNKKHVIAFYIMNKVGQKDTSINLKPSSPIFNLDNTTKKVDDYVKHLITSVNSDKTLLENEKEYLIDLVNTAHQSAKNGSIVKPKASSVSNDFLDKVAVQFSELICPLYAIGLLKETGLSDIIPRNISDLKIKIPNDSVQLYDYEIISGNQVLKVSVKGGRIPQQASLDALFGNVNVVKFNTIFKNNERIVSSSAKKRYGDFESIVANKVMTGAGQANALMAVAQIFRSYSSNAKRRELEEQLFDYYKFDNRQKKDSVINWFKSLRRKYNGHEKISSVTANKKHLTDVQEWLQHVRDNRKSRIPSKFDVANPNDYTVWYASFACELALTRHSGITKQPVNDNTNSNYRNFMVEKFIKEYKIILQSFAAKKGGDIETKISVKEEDLKDWFSIRSKNSFGNYQDKIGIDPVGRNR